MGNLFQIKLALLHEAIIRQIFEVTFLPVAISDREAQARKHHRSECIAISFIAAGTFASGTFVRLFAGATQQLKHQEDLEIVVR